MVRQLIEEAQRIPDAPPLPVDYEQLLTDLVRWIEECEAANGDVDTAIQVRGGGRWWHTAQGERLTEGSLGLRIGAAEEAAAVYHVPACCVV
jgi:hypothetical protein